MTDDLISRAEAIEEIEFGITNMKAINMETGEVIEPFAKINAELREAVNRVKELPSAQPEEFEWCTDCKEYDQERHCCHRWAKVIRKTVDEIKAEQRWIPCSERLPNHDEYIKNNGLFNVSDGDRSYSEWFDIHDKQMFGEPTISGFRVDYAVIAWMPLPETYGVE